jgi:hypothetical protein
VDAAGSAYVTGGTKSGDFPTTPGAPQTVKHGYSDAFVTKVNSAGNGLVYSTYLGGGQYESAKGIAVDALGSAYVIGRTGSIDFPTTSGAYRTVKSGAADVFVTKLDVTGRALVYSTFLGGNDHEWPAGIAVDAVGSAYVAGSTRSLDFPTTLDAYQTVHGGSGYRDVFLAKFNPAGSALLYSTYLGGLWEDEGGAVAVDSAGAAYVTGWTQSSDFPTTLGAYKTVLRNYRDAFVTKIPLGSCSGEHDDHDFEGNCDDNNGEHRDNDAERLDKKRKAPIGGGSRNF